MGVRMGMMMIGLRIVSKSGERGDCDDAVLGLLGDDENRDEFDLLLLLLLLLLVLDDPNEKEVLASGKKLKRQDSSGHWSLFAYSYSCRVVDLMAGGDTDGASDEEERDDADDDRVEDRDDVTRELGRGSSSLLLLLFLLVNSCNGGGIIL